MALHSRPLEVIFIPHGFAVIALIIVSSKWLIGGVMIETVSSSPHDPSIHLPDVSIFLFVHATFRQPLSARPASPLARARSPPAAIPSSSFFLHNNR